MSHQREQFMSTFTAIGIMSGTSLDGLDLAYCIFDTDNPAAFEIVQAITFAYPSDWKLRLTEAGACSAFELVKLNTDYSRYCADRVREFLNAHGLSEPEILAFHGHTVFHQPEIGITCQLGSPAVLATQSGITTVGDFRTGNVSLGGQGAPLVPVGDVHLFGNYDARLNLGGFGNISFGSADRLMAFDICPVNMALNEMAETAGKNYDENGSMAASGQINDRLLQALNLLPFYKKEPPKSLGREWYEQHFRPVLSKFDSSPEDALATLCEHIAIQISGSLSDRSAESMIATGGGAHNNHLINRLRHHCTIPVHVPEKNIVDFKEALVFAYLGWLRWKQEINCFSSYTGSKKDHCSGSIHLA